MEEGLLIALVENHPNLYNKKGKDFKDARMKEQSWDEIAAAMDVTVDECQRVWRLLRDRFAKEKRLLKAQESGGAADHVPWTLFPSMQFLEEHVKPRRTTSNVVETKGNSSPNSSRSHSRSENSVASTFDTMQEIIGQQSYYIDDGTSQDISGDEENVEEIEVPATSTQVSRATKRKKPSTDMDDRVSKALETMSEYLTLQNKGNSDDAFATYVSTTIKELPKNKKKLAKRQILKILESFEEEDDDE